MRKRMVFFVFLFCAATAISASAQTFTTLANFNGTDGSNAYASPVQGMDGNLYGTTGDGGNAERGNVFKMTPESALTSFYGFCSESNCADGEFPGWLILASDGNFYGTTSGGGATNGNGTVFKISPRGKLTTLHSFCSETNCADGQYPYAVIQAAGGNFYGTTRNGGTEVDGYGTIFKITSQGTLTTVHDFDLVDGGGPYGLVQAIDGNFYGVTEGGGGNGGGTVFKITPQGTLTTLYSFCSEANCADGEVPVAGLVQARDGSFYGVTFRGGTYLYGTVFKITPAGTLTTLYSFDDTDGSYPDGVLVQATNGNFYGTTPGGGAYGDGTVFEITSGGTLTSLHSFDGTDGEQPGGGLSQATSGLLYGTTESGGIYGVGTVFSLSLGLGRFVETIPAAGKVGENITILGDGLKGSTAVSFNGTPATTFTVANTAIRVTVPAGATTGRVEVVTASGRVLKSNAKFRIIP